MGSGPILTLNAGSSTIKFAVFDAPGLEARSVAGALDRTASRGATLAWRTGADAGRLDVPDETPHLPFLLDWLGARPEASAIRAVGHRVVHGLARTEPALLTDDVIDELRRAEPYAPHHLPPEIAVIEAVGTRLPHVPQIACFDTAFHRGMPAVARRLPLPRRYEAKGLQRYGFHGLSYAYLLEELARVAGPTAATGRVILAHLGHGASLAAVHQGQPVDTTMGFTPAGGLIMSTRTGDLDPGVVAFLARTEAMTAERFHRLVNHESGLIGISETSADMRELLAREPHDPRAADAVAMFCYQAKKGIGALTAALGGLDTLVFSAGIGQSSAVVRRRLCDGLDCLGVALDDSLNAADAPVISTGASRVTVRVMRTDEELMIARLVCRTLDQPPRRKDALS